jgi:hypothetical protein
MDNSCDDPGTKEAEKGESRKLVKSIFLALLAGLLINIFMGLLVDFGELRTAFKETSLVAVLVPFMIVFIIYVIDTLRFKLVFPKFGIKISFRDGLYNNIIGYFFCNITPGSVGGQPFQVLHLSRLGLESTIVSNVIFSRLIEGNIVQLFIVAIFFHKGIGMMASLGKGAFLLIAGMLITITMTVVLILTFSNPHLLGTLALRMEKSGLGKLIARITRNPCWAEKISVWSQGLGSGFKVLWSKNMGTMLLDILIFMVEQLLWAASLYIPLTILTGTASPFPEFLLSYILCGLVSLFIPTPGAAGSIEASYLLVLSALTGKPAATMSAILVWRFGVYYLHLLVGGLVYFLKPMKRAVYKPGKDGILSHIRKRRGSGVKPDRPEAGP